MTLRLEMDCSYRVNQTGCDDDKKCAIASDAWTYVADDSLNFER